MINSLIWEKKLNKHKVKKKIKTNMKKEIIKEMKTVIILKNLTIRQHLKCVTRSMKEPISNNNYKIDFLCKINMTNVMKMNLID